MIAYGLMLSLVGIFVVFAFLVLLWGVTSLTSFLILRYFPEKTKVSSKLREGELAAAIATAYQAWLKQKEDL